MKRLLSVLTLAASCPLNAEDSAPARGTPFTEESYWAPVMTYQRPGSLHGICNLDLSDHYITPQGLHLENQGLIAQPLLMFYTPLYADPTQWLSNATLTLGGWGSWHSHKGGDEPANWREVNLYGGLACTMDRNWKLSAFNSVYLSQTDSYPTAWDCALALTYDDTELLRGGALHPFIEFKWQTHGSTTVAFIPDNADESYSVRMGIIPQRQFEHFKLEIPAFITLVPKGYYQRSPTADDALYYQPGEGHPAPGGIGFMSAAVKLTMPLERLSTKDISTSLYAALQYYRIVNPGLLDINQVLGATSEREKNILQFHLGLNFTF